MTNHSDSESQDPSLPNSDPCIGLSLQEILYKLSPLCPLSGSTNLGGGLRSLIASSLTLYSLV